jgi:CO/xanthine dehydrogenase Mo-binding subunit
MSDVASSRRHFLRVALAAGGALALGVDLTGCTNFDPKTVAHYGRTHEFRPNAWLKILPDDRIVFLLDRVEFGQGTTTSHAALIADELEVDPAKITVEHAPASRDYDLPLLDLGFQSTGGSSSVRTSWEPLRKAGAVAREMLKAAAASEWDVPIEELKVDDGVISHAAKAKRTTYGKLLATACRQPVPDPPLKPASQWKWIGKSVVRLDGRPKVDGSAVYGIDVRVPGMLTAVVVRSPVLAGKLKSFRADAAKAQPGVVDVFEIPTGVAVVAKSYWEARTASKKLDITWDEGPLAKTTTASLRADYAARAKSPGAKVQSAGDVEKAWSGGGKVLEAVYEVPYLAHATMEPQNATAHFTGNRCEVWAPTQSPGLVVEEVFRITHLDRGAIEVHTTHVGGAFGRRLMQDYVAEAVHCSMHTGKPVKVVWSREDDLTHDFYRPMTYNVLKGAIDASGKITGWFHRIVAQSPAAQTAEMMAQAAFPYGMPESMKAMLSRTAAGYYKSGTLPDMSVLDGAHDFAYAIPNLQVEHVTVDLPVPCGFWRAVGHSENVYIVESFVDELARAAGKDPLEVRRAMLAGSPQHLAVLDRAAKESGWGTPPPKGVSRGIAVCKAFGTYVAQVAEVSVEDGVRVRRIVAAVDCGTVVNPDLVKAQVESAIVFGLSAALRQRVTLKDGKVEQTNFHTYEPVRMVESPKIEVHLIASDAPPQGAGEPGLPPLAPAVANAIFAATGKPVRTLPIEVAMAEAK